MFGNLAKKLARTHGYAGSSKMATATTTGIAGFSDAATTVAAPKTTKAPAKAATNGKPAAAKKPATAKAPAKAAKEAPAVQGTERSKDLPWCDKKVAIFKALKQLKAVTGGSAVAASAIIEKAGGTLTGRDVRHYCYHAAAANLVGVAKVEGIAGWGFHLTAKGAAIDPVKEFKAQETAKAAK